MSFKAVIWNEAASVVNNVPGLKGARKSNASCKNKYAKVFFPPFLIFSILKMILVEGIAAIKGQSGFKWDDEKGADIGPESEAVWDEYVKVCSMILLQFSSLHWQFTF